MYWLHGVDYRPPRDLLWAQGGDACGALSQLTRWEVYHSNSFVAKRNTVGFEIQTVRHRPTGQRERRGRARGSTRSDQCGAKPGDDRSPSLFSHRVSPGPALHRPGTGRATGHRGEGHHLRLRRYLW